MSDVPTCLVFGATGPVGRALLVRLVAAGERVAAVSRAEQPDSDGVHWHRVDLYAPEPGEPPSPGTVFSAGPLDGFAAWCRRQPLAAGTRIVALSSTSAETKHDSENPLERALARSLRQSEQQLFELGAVYGCAVTMLRPTLIYGNGPDRNLSRLTAIARRCGRLPLPASAIGQRQPVHADDLAAALQTCARRPDLAAEVLTLPGGETLSYRAMVQRHLTVAAPGFRVWLIPEFFSRLAVRTLALGPAETRKVASELARSAKDMVFPGQDWRRLGLQPRAFRPETD